MVGDRARPALLAFFLPLTRRTSAELGVGDDTIAGYLAEVLTEFTTSATTRLFMSEIEQVVGAPSRN